MVKNSHNNRQFSKQKAARLLYVKTNNYLSSFLWAWLDFLHLNAASHIHCTHSFKNNKKKLTNKVFAIFGI